uniref:Carotene cleavage dioxygenase 4 copy 1 n=1 Tax=Bixa orellana TaxID=66672 RepID=A0A140CWS3_BIXOR|nr:carotene cleavage dioxygenase 4 copy 1 [Bixa orellana]
MMYYSISSSFRIDTICYHDNKKYSKFSNKQAGESRLHHPKKSFSFTIKPNLHFQKLKMGMSQQKITQNFPPPPFLLPHLASMAFLQIIFSSLSKLIAPPLDLWIDPSHVFTENFAPVEEMDPIECPIEGELPPSLHGAAYIRNGTNPQYKPQRALHIFEGDGMLHSLRFSEGDRAVYSSRYVRTYKFMIERGRGAAIIPTFFSGFYGLIDIASVFTYLWELVRSRVNPMNHGFGGANVSLGLLGKKLLALNESDLPYIMNLTDDGDIETVGRWDFDEGLLASMTAHPKFDKDTKETFAFRYLSLLHPYLTFFKFDQNGVKQNEVKISSMERLCFIHDFAVTKRFLIIEETQLAASIAKVLLGRGSIFYYNPKNTPRFGVLPRHATDESELMWFQAPGFNAMHYINAWENEEDDDEIILVGTNVISLENLLSRRVRSSLDKVIINMRTGKVSRKTLSPRCLDLGSINPNYAGKRNKYAYMSVMEEIPRTSGVVKIDLETGVEVASRIFGDGCYGGEPLFVRKNIDNKAKENGASSDVDDEDDGYVLSYVHDEKSEESKFIVMDAKSPDLQIVAAVKIPRRVPYGFHGIFLSKEDLLSLKN